MCVGITPLKRSKLKLSGVTCNISTCAFTVNVLGILSANFFLLFRVALLEASVQVVSAAGAAGAATETTASAGTRYPHQVSTCTRTEVYTYDTVQCTQCTVVAADLVGWICTVLRDIPKP